jgi:hypothetical protein
VNSLRATAASHPLYDVPSAAAADSILESSSGGIEIDLFFRTTTQEW